MKTVNDKMRENNDKEKKFAYPLVANSVESSVIVEKLSLQSPSQPGSANVRTGEGVGYELNFVSHLKALLNS